MFCLQSLQHETCLKVILVLLLPKLITLLQSESQTRYPTSYFLCIVSHMLIWKTAIFFSFLSVCLSVILQFADTDVIFPVFYSLVSTPTEIWPCRRHSISFCSAFVKRCSIRWNILFENVLWSYEFCKKGNI